MPIRTLASMSGYKLRKMVAHYSEEGVELPRKGTRSDLKVRMAFGAANLILKKGYSLDAIKNVILWEAPDGGPGRLEITMDPRSGLLPSRQSIRGELEQKSGETHGR